MDYKTVIKEAERGGNSPITVRLDDDVHAALSKIVSKEKRKGKSVTINRLINAICRVALKVFQLIN